MARTGSRNDPGDQLHTLMVRDDVSGVMKVLADVEKSRPNGLADLQAHPILLASRLGAIQTLRRLLEDDRAKRPQQAKVVASEALYTACEYDFTRSAIECLRAGADPNFVPDASATKASAMVTDCSALDHAAGNGNALLVRALIGNGGTVNREACQMPSLSYAVANGHVECAVSLLKAGAKPSKTDYYGWCSVVHACRNGEAAMLWHLADYGGLKSITGDQATQFVMGAVNMADEQSLDTLLLLEGGIARQKCDSFDVLETAARRGNVDVCGCLVEHGMEPSVTNRFVVAPIAFAALNDHEDCVWVIMAHHAKVALECAAVL